MCVICRQRFAKSQLLRYVPAMEGSATGNGLEADASQTKPGRGWYVCSDPKCQERFAGKKFRRKHPRGSNSWIR